jgi:hypothetical protein
MGVKLYCPGCERTCRGLGFSACEAKGFDFSYGGVAAEMMRRVDELCWCCTLSLLGFKSVALAPWTLKRLRKSAINIGEP